MRFGTIVMMALALAACQRGEGSGFGSEIGSGLVSDGFGSADANNMAMMISPRDAAISLTRKFAAEAPNTVNFAFDSAVLDGQAMAALAQQANWIRQYPQVRFRVYGYTDLVGSNAYNKALGLRRAQAVVNVLVSQGISRNRLEAVVSYGKTQPLVYTPGPNERNRRAVTEVSGFLKGSSQVMNGKYAEVIFQEYVKSATPTPSNAVSNQQTAGQATNPGGGGS